MNKIGEFLKNEMNLKSLIDILNSTDLQESDVTKVIEENGENERSYILCVLAFFLKKVHFENNDLPFIGFLKSISTETDNDFSQEVIWHFQNDDAVVFQIDHVYFLINNHNEKFIVDLPENIRNTCQLCVNCNDELYLGSDLSLLPREFYLISDSK